MAKSPHFTRLRRLIHQITGLLHARRRGVGVCFYRFTKEKEQGQHKYEIGGRKPEGVDVGQTLCLAQDSFGRQRNALWILRVEM